MEDINRNGAYIQRRKMYLQYRICQSIKLFTISKAIQESTGKLLNKKIDCSNVRRAKRSI